MNLDRQGHWERVKEDTKYGKMKHLLSFTINRRAAGNFRLISSQLNDILKQNNLQFYSNRRLNSRVALSMRCNFLRFFFMNRQDKLNSFKIQWNYFPPQTGGDVGIKFVGLTPNPPGLAFHNSPDCFSYHILPIHKKKSQKGCNASIVIFVRLKCWDLFQLICCGSTFFCVGLPSVDFPF